MKSTKVQTLGGIWRKYWNILIENTFHAYVLGEHTSMKNELKQTNVKSQGFIYKTSFQHNLHWFINACTRSKKLVSNKPV